MISIPFGKGVAKPRFVRLARFKKQDSFRDCCDQLKHLLGRNASEPPHEVVNKAEARNNIIASTMFLQEPNHFGARDLARFQTVNAPADFNRGPINLYSMSLKS